MQLLLVGAGGFVGAIARLGPADLRIPILVGFVGAYTTFSTYLLDSWRLVEQGNWPLAAVSLFGSIALGLAALLVGMTLGRSV